MLANDHLENVLRKMRGQDLMDFPQNKKRTTLFKLQSKLSFKYELRFVKTQTKGTGSSISNLHQDGPRKLQAAALFNAYAD